MSAPKKVPAGRPNWWPLAKAMSEAELLDNVVALCDRLGYFMFHPRPVNTLQRWLTAFRGKRGYPDCTMVHPDGAVVFAELKKQDGPYGEGQKEWLAALAAAGVPTFTWRPSDWLSQTIHQVLQGELVKARARNLEAAR